MILIDLDFHSIIAANKSKNTDNNEYSQQTVY